MVPNRFIMYANCQGYLNNKCLIENVVNVWKPMIICLTETHIVDTIDQKELQIHGYTLENCVSDNTRTGGVLILIQSNIKYKVLRNEVSGNYSWMLSVELTVYNKKYLVSAIYHSPQKSDGEFLQYFNEFLDNTTENNGTAIIVGDFNINLKKDTYYSKIMKDTIYQHGLYQLVQDYTRITDTSKTLIDYIITNDKNLQHEVHLTPKVSDHSDHSILTVKLLKGITRDITAMNFKTFYCKQLGIIASVTWMYYVKP